MHFVSPILKRKCSFWSYWFRIF